MGERTQLAKIQPPLVEGVIPRVRLHERLDGLRHAPVIWVAGGAGYGKTTLVADYLKRQGIEPLWYQFDAGDRDPADFFHYLARAACRVTAAETALPTFRPEHLAGLDVFARKTFRALLAALPDPAVMVFDNFQDLPEDAPLHSVWPGVFEEVPDGANVIVVSRRRPPASLVRLMANRRLVVLDERELAFDLDETAALVRLLGHAAWSEAEIESLHRRHAGWCAGMILALQGAGDGGGEEEAIVFDYLAREVFAALPAEARRVLLATAFLPEVTADDAMLLSGIDSAGDWLARLCDARHFVSRHGGAPVTWQVHPLFREFLLQQGADGRLDPAERERMMVLAAGRLVEMGYLAEAAALHAERGDTAALVELVLDQAPALAAAGRTGLLADLLARLDPQEATRPWIRYWRAVVDLGRDLGAARSGFETALTGFEAAGDRQGLCLAWAGIVDAVILGWDDFRPLDHWIDWMAARLEAHPEFPSPEAAARVTIGMFVALTYHRLGHADLPGWAERVTALMEQMPDPTQRILIANHLMVYHSWMGDMTAAEGILERMQPLVEGSGVHELQQIYWYHMRALMLWLKADFTASAQALDTAEHIAESSGIHVLDFILALLRTFLAMLAGPAAERRTRLERLHALAAASPGRLGHAHYHYVMALDAILRGDEAGAFRHLESAYANASAVGIPFAEASVCLAMARCAARDGQLAVAREWLERARRYDPEGRSLTLDFTINLARSQVEMDAGDLETADACLATALARGRQGGFCHLDWWVPEWMVEHCLRALERELETSYVQTLIRRHDLRPPAPPLELDNWPWRIRIHTLGRFGIRQDGEDALEASASRRKPVMLLKALVAFGGRDVPESRITEALWPDAEGDAAHNAFTTNLSRLRRLLGQTVLVVRDGNLTLDDRLCWVDTWAFERAITRLDRALSGERPERAVVETGMARVLSLYQGDFLAREEPSGWLLAQRERYRLKLLRILQRLIGYFQQVCDCRQVMALYQRVVHLDPCEESAWRGLMRCHAGLGDRAEALAAYERCETLLQANFGVPPAEKTRHLYRRIRDAAAADLPSLCDSCQRPLAGTG